MISEGTSQNTGTYEEIEHSSCWVPLCQRDHLSIIHIIGICCSMLAYQIAYSVEFALGNPIMESELLGIEKFWQSFIWLAGPLSGFIVQPLIGFYSDNATFKLGRRRPYIIIGCVGIVIGFLGINFVEAIGKLFNKENPRVWCIVIFIFSLILTNISINVLQGPSRALLGDLIPKHQQVIANSIGSLMLGVAAIITNFIGGFNLAQYTHGLFNSQQLVIISGCVILVIGVVITLCCAKEEVYSGNREGRKNPLVQIFAAAKSMPKEVLRISIVYLLSWMGYFMFNVECTDYVGNDLFSDRGLDYNDGVNFGMLIIGVSNILVLLFGMVQEKVMELLGVRWAYAMSQIVEAACLIPLPWVHNKWVALALLAPLGISCTIFNSVPFAVVGTIVAAEDMGTYMGLLNSFAVTGQQLVNWIVGSGLGSLVKSPKAWQLTAGSVFAIAAAIMCKWIVVAEDGKSESQLDKLDPLLKEEV